MTKACFHDPAINRTYGDMAAHYDTAVVPARPRKPKDKAKVETAVQRVVAVDDFSPDELNRLFPRMRRTKAWKEAAE